MLRTPQFYVMYAMFVLMATGGLLVTANAGPMAQSWGFTAGALTLAATLSPLANGASRIFWGWASDRIGRETTMIVAFVLQADLPVPGRRRSASCSGALVRVHARARLLHVGRDLLALPVDAGRLLRHARTRRRTTRVLYTAKGVASIIGGWVGALLYEQSGSWSVGFYGSAVMALVAAGMAVALRAARAPAPAVAAVPAAAK